MRRAREDEAAAVAALVEAAFARHVEAVGRRPAPMDDDPAAQIAAGRQWVRDAEDGSGALASSIVLVDAGDHLVVNNVAVAPAYQGRGYGRDLLAFAEAEARRRGHAEVRLHTNAAMADNLVMYPRLGYAEVGRAFDAGFHRVFYVKALVALRPSAPSDDAAVISWLRSAEEVERAAGPSLTWPVTAAQLQALRDDPAIASFAATVPAEGDAPVARLDVVRTGDASGRLARVVVDPARRGQGLARPIVGLAVAWAREQGMTELDLRVFADNAPAIKVYASLGFGEREPFGDDGRVVTLRARL